MIGHLFCEIVTDKIPCKGFDTFLLRLITAPNMNFRVAQPLDTEPELPAQRQV